MSLKFILVLSFLTKPALTARVLLLPADHKGHANLFGVAARALQERGHEVLVLAQERHRSILENMDIPLLLNPTKSSFSPLEDYGRLMDMFESSGIDQLLKGIDTMTNASHAAVSYCYEVIENEDIMQIIKSKNFDVAVVDGLPVARCYYIIPYKLNIPYVTLTAASLDPWVTKVPAMPSMEGMFGMFHFPEEPNFFERMANLMIYTMIYTFASIPRPFTDSQIAELAPEMPQTTYLELYRNSKVFLINNDNYCMDYPRAEAPHHHYIGGAAAHPPEPLPKNIADFVNGANDGLVVVSFGSLVKRAPDEIMVKLMDTFKSIPLHVIMRYDGVWGIVPENVMLVKWLPQNDLLGHPKAVLYIAHGGNNGQTEGHYHGVPMIVMPFGGDQMYAAQRVEYKKVGKLMNPFDFDSDTLHRNIHEVIHNPIYRNNIKKCSDIIKSFPSPHDQIDFWIRHVVRFGGDHLRPPHMALPLYKYFMLDIFTVLLIGFVLLSYVIIRLCKYTYSKCSGKDKKKVKSE